MKQNLRRLNAIIKLFGVDNIYQTDVNKFGVTIYAHLSPEVDEWLKSHKFKLKPNDGWNLTKWIRGSYSVILH